MAIEVTSPVFEHEGLIPSTYTCDGRDISPPLQWTAGPRGTACYALIMDDPDAPAGIWTHWIAWNIGDTSLPEGIDPGAPMPGGGVQGVNSWRKVGYGGPCPPSGTHRYFFRVYALDTKLNLPAASTKKALLEAMKGHVLDEGELMGRYARVQ